MLLKQVPHANDYGKDTTAALPPADAVTGVEHLDPAHDAIWGLAAPYLKIHDNDVHTLYAYGLANALLALHPEADPEVVLPAILRHDKGWSRAPEDEVPADKLWRLTPHGGADPVMDWFGLDREQAHRLIGSRVRRASTQPLTTRVG